MDDADKIYWCICIIGIILAVSITTLFPQDNYVVADNSIHYNDGKIIDKTIFPSSSQVDKYYVKVDKVGDVPVSRDEYAKLQPQDKVNVTYYEWGQWEVKKV